MKEVENMTVINTNTSQWLLLLIGPYIEATAMMQEWSTIYWQANKSMLVDDALNTRNFKSYDFTN